MDTYRSHRSTAASDRFLNLLSGTVIGTASPTANGGHGVELHEDEVLWIGSDSSDPISSPMASSSSLRSKSASPSANSLRRIPEKNSGILAVLPEDDKRRRVVDSALPFVQRKSSISSSSASTSPSSSSSARMIPAIPKPKPDYGGGKVFHQSVPVNIPIPPRFERHKLEGDGAIGDGDDAEGDDEEMLPPHEIIARRSGVFSPMTTFSVLEGAGRTLKGRDLRRVRNAVWRKTGFLD